MHGDRLNKKLAALHQAVPTDSRQKQALEAELLNRYRQRHGRSRRWLTLFNPWTHSSRLALTGLALMVLSIGACTTETTTQIEAGQQASISLEVGGFVDGQGSHLEKVQVIREFLSSQVSVDQVDVTVNQSVGENGLLTADLVLMIWGTDLEPEVLTASLREEFPDLAEVDIRFEPLQTSITESWMDRLGRQVMHIEIDGETAEEIRAQIIQQLADQGITGNASVEVIDEGGTREIRIELEEEVPE